MVSPSCRMTRVQRLVQMCRNAGSAVWTAHAKTKSLSFRPSSVVSTIFAGKPPMGMGWLITNISALFLENTRNWYLIALNWFHRGTYLGELTPAVPCCRSIATLSSYCSAVVGHYVLSPPSIHIALWCS